MLDENAFFTINLLGCLALDRHLTWWEVTIRPKVEHACLLRNSRFNMALKESRLSLGPTDFKLLIMDSLVNYSLKNVISNPITSKYHSLCYVGSESILSLVTRSCVLPKFVVLFSCLIYLQSSFLLLLQYGGARTRYILWLFIYSGYKFSYFNFIRIFNSR